MVEPNTFSSVVSCALDDNEDMRKFSLQCLISGLFGMKKAQGQALILNPLWTVVLVFLAEDPQREAIGTLARNALFRYVQGMRARLMSKQKFIMESFTPHF